MQPEKGCHIWPLKVPPAPLTPTCKQKDKPSPLALAHAVMPHLCPRPPPRRPPGRFSGRLPPRLGRRSPPASLSGGLPTTTVLNPCVHSPAHSLCGLSQCCCDPAARLPISLVSRADQLLPQRGRRPTRLMIF
eukprot:EG_transcript_29800